MVGKIVISLIDVPLSKKSATLPIESINFRGGAGGAGRAGNAILNMISLACTLVILGQLLLACHRVCADFVEVGGGDLAIQIDG